MRQCANEIGGGKERLVGKCVPIGEPETVGSCHEVMYHDKNDYIVKVEQDHNNNKPCQKIILYLLFYKYLETNNSNTKVTKKEIIQYFSKRHE